MILSQQHRTTCSESMQVKSAEKLALSPFDAVAPTPRMVLGLASHAPAPNERYSRHGPPPQSPTARKAWEAGVAPEEGVQNAVVHGC